MNLLEPRKSVVVAYANQPIKLATRLITLAIRSARFLDLRVTGLRVDSADRNAIAPIADNDVARSRRPKWLLLFSLPESTVATDHLAPIFSPLVSAGKIATTTILRFFAPRDLLF